MYKYCKNCGKFFDALTDKVKYCSDKCAKNKSYYVKKSLKEKICKECKKHFNTRRSTKVFCSDSCRLNYHDTGTIYKKICKECGKQFDTGKSFQFYCNHNCYITAKIKRDRENQHGSKHS